MALFFDAEWFDARLAARGLSRRVMAAATGLSEADLALMFKDQRELSAAEVSAFAELLGEEASEVASRAGVSTPDPSAQSATEMRLAALERRVAVLEIELARLRSSPTGEVAAKPTEGVEAHSGVMAPRWREP